MKKIELSKITVKDDKIFYEVTQEQGIGLLKQDVVELFVRFHYDENIHVNLNQIPQSILAVPISLYLLPLTYFYKIELVLPLMDKTLYEHLPEIYTAYSKMYGPFDEEWRGKLTIKNIDDNSVSKEVTYDKIVFFSGGVDACSAGINNSGCRTLLVSIPDIERQAKNEGPLREEKFSLIKTFSNVVNSDWVLISNNFNATLFRDSEINNYLKEQKGLNSPAFEFDGWWGIKYLANMCCVAPLAYLFGIKSLIMGSAFEPYEEERTISNDGAHPLLSNSIAFADIRFGEQDELTMSRSKKVCKIIEWCKLQCKKVKLWVCFNDGASQCGICPKCVRTQLDILCACENPKEWGFEKFEEKNFSDFIKSYRYYENNPCWLWDIVEAINDNCIYPYCNEMLQWLKRIGYKEYLKRARSRIEYQNWINQFQKILLFQKYPHYLKLMLKRFMKSSKVK